MYSILDEFSENQLEELENKYPAFRRYLHLIKKDPNSTNFKIRRHHEWMRVVAHSHFNSESQKTLLNRWSLFFIDEIKSYTLENPIPDKLSLVSLGKLGALELNLSSDIDVILVGNNSDENLKWVRKFIQNFEGRDEFAFFTRVDIDIRPGGNHSPMIQSYTQVENYYYNHGETWERLALIRMRPIFYDKDTKKQLEELRRKFCFRRHIDFNSLEDFSRLRTRIHQEQSKSLNPKKINLKLCRGGIRDVELFTHSLIILHGGRSPQLDTSFTDEGLQKLCELGIIPPSNSEFLTNHYWKLRRLENLVQSQEDAQTHFVHLDSDLIRRVYSSQEELLKDLRSCDHLVGNFIQVDADTSSQIPSSDDDLTTFLEGFGLDHENSLPLFKEILSYTAKSRFSEKDEQIRKEVIISFLKAIQEESENKQLALETLNFFFKAIRVKASLFKFFQVHPQVLGDLARLFGFSQYLGQIICRRPELVDNFVYRAQATPPEDLESLLEYLADHKQLGHILYSLDYTKHKNLERLSGHISEIADFIARALLAKLTEDTKIDILKLGKWGGGEMGLKSDLDFVFVYKSPHIPEEIYKIPRKFVSLMDANYRAGNLYGIDMRLRPSGNAGPLLVTEPNLIEYLKSKAAPWERQAYLKAKFLNSDKNELKKVLLSRSLTDEDRLELSEISEKLIHKIIPEAKSVDLKYSEGGIVDCELSVQRAILEENRIFDETSNFSFFEIMQSLNPLWKTVLENYTEIRSLEQSLVFFRQTSSSKMEQQDFDVFPQIKNFGRGTDSLKDLILLLKENQTLLSRLRDTQNT